MWCEYIFFCLGASTHFHSFRPFVQGSGSHNDKPHPPVRTSSQDGDRFGLAGNCRAVELGQDRVSCDVPYNTQHKCRHSVGFCQEIMAYSPFPEGHVNFEGHFRVILFRQGQHVQPETWQARSKFSLETFRAQHEMKTLAEKKVRIASQKPLETEMEAMKPKAFSSGGWIWIPVAGATYRHCTDIAIPRIFERLKASQTIKDIVLCLMMLYDVWCRATPYQLNQLIVYPSHNFGFGNLRSDSIRTPWTQAPSQWPRPLGSRPHGASDVDGGPGAHRGGARAARADALRRRRRAARAAPDLRRAAAVGAARCGGALRPAETWVDLGTFFWHGGRWWKMGIWYMMIYDIMNIYMMEIDGIWMMHRYGREDGVKMSGMGMMA